MDVVITQKTKELLDSLKKQLILDFEQMHLPETVKVIESFDYNDMIMVLNLGFSEKAFYESMQGKLNAIRFSLTKSEVDKIQVGIRAMKRGT
jgi:hypothetical protein